MSFSRKYSMRVIPEYALICSFFAIALFPLSAAAVSDAEELLSAQPLLEKFDKGYINWKSGEYVANVSAPVAAEYRGKTVNQAMGKELALRVSRALADSVFLQIVADTRVDANHRLSQLVKDDAEIKLAGNIRGKELIKQQWVNKNNKVWLEASYRIAMRGVDGVISHVYDQVIKTRPASGDDNEKTNSTQKTVVYIDARGTGLQPALFPDILDPQHARLFDPAAAGKTYVSENGAVEYVVSKSKEPISTLVDPGNSITVSAIHPALFEWLVIPTAAEDTAPVRKRKKRKAVKATEATGLLKSNIIVSKEDAERLRRSQEKGTLSGNPRIIVITDGTVGGTEGRLLRPRLLWASHSPGDLWIASTH